MQTFKEREKEKKGKFTISTKFHIKLNQNSLETNIRDDKSDLNRELMCASWFFFRLVVYLKFSYSKKWLSKDLGLQL